MKKLMAVLALILASAMVFAEDYWESIWKIPYEIINNQLKELQAAEKEKMPNDIQRRKNWAQLLDDCAEMVNNRSLFSLVYDPTLEYGKVNYQTETQDISFTALVQCNNAAFSMVYDLRNGLKATGKAEEWGLDRWPEFEPEFKPGSYIVTASLINDTGKVISKSESKVLGHDFSYSFFKFFGNAVDSPALWGNGPETVTFKGVNVNDITDTLTISIDTVNAIPAGEAEQTGYTHIASENLSEYEYPDNSGYAGGVFHAKRIGNFLVSPAAHNGWVLLKYYLPEGNTAATIIVDLPAYIEGKPVLAIYKEALEGERVLNPDARLNDKELAIVKRAIAGERILNPDVYTDVLLSNLRSNRYTHFGKPCKVIIPDTVVYIYEHAIGFGITELVIPQSVVHIGDHNYSDLTQITLPADLNKGEKDSLSETGFHLFLVGDEYWKNGKKAGTFIRADRRSGDWQLKTW